MKTLINTFIQSKTLTDCLAQLESYKNLYNSRKTLASLDDNMLKDIGVTRAEAEKEAGKPFWQTNKDCLINNEVETKQAKRFNRFNKVSS